MPKQQPPDPPLLPPVEEVAQAIVDLSAAVRKMTSARLRKRAIIILLHDQCRVGMNDIQRVLDSLERMDAVWLKPLETKKETK